MATDCAKGILASIVSTCDTVGNGGNEVKAWIMNRSDATVTYDTTDLNKITTLAGTAYSLTGVLKSIDSGFDRNVNAGLPDRFSHFASFSNYSFDAANGINLDNLQDLIFIVESRDKDDDGDGTFRAYGVKYGLDVLSDTHRANTDKGVRSLELGSRDGDDEPYSYYVVDAGTYATTLTMLDALLA